MARVIMIDNRHIKNFSKKLKNINNEFKNSVQVVKRADRVLFNGANDITNTIKQSMRDTKIAKKFYKRGRKKHYPSAEGSPPAIDSGQLLRNTMFDFRPLQVEVGINKNAEYGKYLEKGTKKMKERPFLEPAVNRHKNNIFDKLIDIVPDFAGNIFRRTT